PNSAHADEIPIQSRMMTIADIFDALTAADRPYKKAMEATRAIDILQMEVNGGKIDKAIFDLFVDSKSYEIVKPSKS
ncbi:MAG: HD family phosphohydrolase, partial [Zetaproteobacteria bacterium]|nr:HD family phosphohydrolase [Zetaproteobacteria bacterium]